MNVTVWPRGSNRVYEAPTSGEGSAFASDYGELLRVTCSTRYEQGFGGHDLASWTVLPYGGYLGGLFRPGDHVRITQGGSTLFEGEYSEAAPQDDGLVTLSAKGYAYNLFDYDSVFWNAVDGPDPGHPTSQLVGGDLVDTFYGWEYAIDQLGMPIAQVVVNGVAQNVSSPVDFPGDPLGDVEQAPKPVKVGEVLTGLLVEEGNRWAVWGRTLVVDSDPTTPLWAYDTPTSIVGIADTDYATHLAVWYVNSTSHMESLEWVEDYQGIKRFDVKTTIVDYRGAGEMTTAKANALGSNLLEMVKGRFILNGSFTITPESGFRSIGGGLVTLVGFVRAGQMVKLNAARTSQGTLIPDAQFIIGRTEYQWENVGDGPGQESMQITPMGAVPRDLGSILAGQPPDAGERMSGAA